ncbi:MAG: glycoside hydrolase family 3 C-terminal domain-containing protein [Candidatus Heimdallarchaeota archaeon]|nr:glycoside hydrolase family 3 C-terminal domain-containing protein [Candidatus Heimdallarchaeota archaeon]
MMSLDEKISQMVHMAKSIPRLQISAYNWWNECIHGVGRAGIATVFPQPIGLAAMFDENILYEIAVTISDEARAKYNQVKQKELRSRKIIPRALSETISLYRTYWYRGLTCWSPNINIFRDPRWGRGHETYGEDPFLTSRLGVAFVKGLQGEDENYIKVIATPKHFAVHSGPEKTRHEFNAIVSERDLHETYLPAFKACVIEAKAGSIMAAYNAINNIPAPANSHFLQHILRDDWGFDGYVVSDCGGIRDLHKNHKFTDKPWQSAAMSVIAGCDLNCGSTYKHLKRAVKEGIIDETIIDTSVKRLIEARFKLGILTPHGSGPYDSISAEIIDCEKHRELALQTSRNSLVLLKNAHLLPLENKTGKIAVIGPNADSLDVLLGNYHGKPSSYITTLQGIREIYKGVTYYTKGSELIKLDETLQTAAIKLAREVELIVVCLGLSPRIEGEEGDTYNKDQAGDKADINLPEAQLALLRTLSHQGKPIISVILAGSPVDLREVDQLSDAIIYAWYPGQDGGKAIAEAIFGYFSPSARLPVTFVRSNNDLPPFEDYRMKGRTYRYLETEPMFPFGFGLSYTIFRYSNLKISWKYTNNTRVLQVEVEVRNTGEVNSDEIVQYYIHLDSSGIKTPNYQLCGFKRISLKPGQNKNITYELTEDMFKVIDNDGKSIPANSGILYVGGSQPDSRSQELTGVLPLSINISFD